jgi:hypothetical protein
VVIVSLHESEIDAEVRFVLRGTAAGLRSALLAAGG